MRAITPACGSASPKTAAPVTLPAWALSWAILALCFSASCPEAYSAASLKYCWQNSRLAFMVASVHSLVVIQARCALSTLSSASTVLGGRCGGIHFSWSSARFRSARRSL